MTDGQFATLIAFLSAFGASCLGTARWAVGRITKALDDNTTSHKAQAEKFIELSTKIDFAFNASQKVSDFLVEENSDVHRRAQELEAKPPKRTPAGGYPTGAGIHGLKRASTRGGNDE